MKGMLFAAVTAGMLSSYGLRNTLGDRSRSGNAAYAEEKGGQPAQRGHGQDRRGEAGRQQIEARHELRRQCRDTRGTLDSLESTVNAAKSNDQLSGAKADLEEASRQLSKLEKQLSSCYRI
jgi:hypothetical protein